MASKALKFASLDSKIEPLLVSIEANIDKAPKVENLMLELHHSYLKPYSIFLSKFFAQSEDELERASSLLKTSLLSADLQISFRKVLAHLSQINSSQVFYQASLAALMSQQQSQTIP
jgi:hypothetical protein